MDVFDLHSIMTGSGLPMAYSDTHFYVSRPITSHNGQIVDVHGEELDSTVTTGSETPTLCFIGRRDTVSITCIV